MKPVPLAIALFTMAAGSLDAQVNSNEGNALPFQINYVEYARISETAGNLGIGTTNPVAKLTVGGNVSVTGMIDVGHTAQACATAISGSIRYETTSDTLQICTSAGWKSLVSSTTAGSSTAASSTGAIQFNSGGSFAGDTSNLFWDDANDRLGIGTTSPSGRLQVVDTNANITIQATDTGGSSNLRLLNNAQNYTVNLRGEVSNSFTIRDVTAGAIDRIVLTTAGNVGIGTTSPVYQFSTVMPYAKTDTSERAISWWASNEAAASNPFGVYLALKGSATASARAAVLQSYNYGASLDGIISLQPNGGNVGIGTTGPNAKLEVNGGISATGVVINGTYVAKGLFTKSDPDAVAFTKTGNGTASVKAGTVVEVNNTLVNFVGATAITMPALTAGTDYAIYACGDGTAKADSNLTSTALCSGGFRKIGGFHYAPGGNATAQSGGDTTAQINAYSFWDLKWKPQCKSPSGMTLVADSFWVDIYLTNTDPGANGTSKYNVTIADGSSPPKIPTEFGGNGTTAYGSFNWYEASEVMQSWGKDLLSQQEFMTAMYGTTEQSSGGTDPTSTVLRQAYTSKWGVMLATGNMWVWGRDSSYRYDSSTWAWTTTAGIRGQSYIQGGYGTVRALLGGYWSAGSNSGSRASNWNYYPWASVNIVGARGRCDHLRLE